MQYVYNVYLYYQKIYFHMTINENINVFKKIDMLIVFIFWKKYSKCF